MDFIKMIKPDTRETAEVHFTREKEYERNGFVRHEQEDTPEPKPEPKTKARKAKE